VKVVVPLVRVWLLRSLRNSQKHKELPWQPSKKFASA
jgi:hypothetical protein